MTMTKTARDLFRERLPAAIEAKYPSVLQYRQQESISGGTLYPILKGEKNVSLDTAERLAQAADVELWELIAPAEVVERERKRRARADKQKGSP